MSSISLPLSLYLSVCVFSRAKDTCTYKLPYIKSTSHRKHIARLFYLFYTGERNIEEREERGRETLLHDDATAKPLRALRIRRPAARSRHRHQKRKGRWEKNNSDGRERYCTGFLTPSSSFFFLVSVIVSFYFFFVCVSCLLSRHWRNVSGRFQLLLVFARRDGREERERERERACVRIQLRRRVD
ncbi:hypothetical protein F4861DRAFT_192457 [Xylaria intraflava]|nr:hypothetical protein F4861DRAFT_192457 [Xylaria intraflava]